ncbi:electron transporter [Methylobacterium sp. V23]|nr:electron transporter [Methylobacterium sp. V23]
MPGAGLARLAQNDLARVGVTPASDARVPLGLAFTDAESGPTTLGSALGERAALLLPVDYTCANVCDPMLAMTGAALAATGLAPGRDVSFVLVGLDPRDDVAAARRMLHDDGGGRSKAGVSEGSVSAVRALVGAAPAVAALTAALGYRFVVDRDTDSIAHPAAAILLTPEGRVARILSPLALNGRDLRLALIEAGEGRGSTLADRLTLLCYGYDAVRGIYTPLIERILSLAAAATVLAIALGVFLLHRRGRGAAGS